MVDVTGTGAAANHNRAFSSAVTVTYMSANQDRAFTPRGTGELLTFLPIRIVHSRLVNQNGRRDGHGRCCQS